MMHLMTQEEIDQQLTEVNALYASPLLEDRIAAILRDMNVGGMGLHPEAAKTKAIAIAKFILEHWPQ